MIVPNLPINQYYNQLVSHFKLLHSTNQIITKLGYSPRNNNKEAQLLSEFKLLTANLNILATNAKLIIIEKLLKNYEDWIKHNSNLIPPYTLRQLLDTKEISRPQALILMQFEYYLHTNDITNRDKMELLLSRCVSQDTDEENLTLEIELLFPSQTSPAVDPEHLETLRFLNKTAKAFDNSTTFTEIECLQEFRHLKSRLRDDFWHPTVLSLITSINLSLKKRFLEIFEQEINEVSLLTDKLLHLNIYKIPKLRSNGWLNLPSIKKYLDKISGILAQNYYANYPKLLVFLRLSTLIRQTAKKYNLSVQETEKLSHIKSWLIINEDTNKETPSMMFLNTKNQLNPSIEIKPIDKHLAEERLKVQIQYIKNTLVARRTHTNSEWIHLKYGWYMLTAPEIEILLLTNSPNNNSTNTQNKLIERAIALHSEMQEALNFYNSRKQFLSSARGIFSISTLSYYLSQAEHTCANLENYSLRLRKQDNHSKTVLLLAQRSKLEKITTELYKLLNSQLNCHNTQVS